jgi:hypothetical protein
MMLIDGQQRLTSLYQALVSGAPVKTTDPRGQDIYRWYYVDIVEALADESNRESAIVGVPQDRKRRAAFGRKVIQDLSTDVLEVQGGLFPLRLVYDANAREDWSDQYKAQGVEHKQRWQEFRSRVLDPIQNHVVPVIKLTKDTPKEAICTVFEKVNTGGVQLTVFELLTATFAGDQGHFRSTGRDFHLAEDWKKVRGRLVSQNVLAEFATPSGNPAFLQAVCLLATRQRKLDFEPVGTSGQPPAISCKRADILRLSLDDYLRWRDPLVEAFRWCGQFLSKEYIFQSRDVPYLSQLVPLAAMRAVLGKTADHRGATDKLRRWFWCGVLGELYGGTTETRSARDLDQVTAWITGHGGEPETVASANFHENRLLTLSTRTSAAYKGMYALMMANGCEDWLRNQRLDFATFSELKVDVHHIFPRAWCRADGVRPRFADSIVNKTAISYETNRSIGDKAPSDYLAGLETRIGADSSAMNRLVATHAIEPAYLRADDFKGFFADRTARLLSLVERAMGKPTVRRVEAPGGDDPRDFPDEGGDAAELVLFDAA